MKGQELKDFLDNQPVLFGLRAKGHLPTIERMLAEGKGWAEIGAAIGWEPATAERHYRIYLEQQISGLREMLAAYGRGKEAALTINAAHVSRRAKDFYRSRVAATLAVKDCSLAASRKRGCNGNMRGKRSAKSIFKGRRHSASVRCRLSYS